MRVFPTRDLIELIARIEAAQRQGIETPTDYLISSQVYLMSFCAIVKYLSP